MHPYIKICVFLLVFLPGSSAVATSPSKNLAQNFISNGGFQVGDGTSLQFQPEKQFLPASILKIPTALLALELLGPEFRFTTRLYLDHEKNLYIQGGGDPFLTSEAVLDICRQLQRQHPELKNINTLFLDDSRYALQGEQASTEHSNNPYDAPNSALAVNFNTISLFVEKNGHVRSGEQQTPTLPIMDYKARLLRLSPGNHRINISSGEHGNDTIPLLYVAELFTAQLAACGIEIQGKSQKKKVPPELEHPTLVYKSEKTLQEMLFLLLHYSNNFIANQIFLQLSLQQQTTPEMPATWERSRQRAASFFHKQLGLSQRDLQMEEGSGLSLNNRITSKAAITVLNRFRPWATLLRKRRNTFVKSGTMPKTGVFSSAGYFSRGKELIAYVILLNQRENTREALLRKLEQFARNMKKTPARLDQAASSHNKK